MSAVPADPPTRFIGCDVGTTSIAVFDSRGGRATTLPNRRKALLAFAERLDATGLVVCQATGGYGDALLEALLAAGRHAHRADARKVKAFIRSFGILGKSDAIDARALAQYGAERHARLARWRTPDPQRDRLQARVATRQDLVAQRFACRNRSKAPGAAAVKAYLDPVLACLDAQIATLEADIQALIRTHAPLKRAAALRTIAGIGETTAATLLALMPEPKDRASELGTLTGKQAASLAGLAPHPRQSGALDGYRRTRGGRPEVRRTLFMAAPSGARHDP